ncbi:hypothetical protein RvY_17037 [Ramazzottius varieornatus]|uniref:J domain-containing protein n=1 Tax=Ramazzottius varieornatus TaxID=947166 RepID=A0A1D1W0P4_RAMVA|nr:hypothetical protein RvY_17037 [Ramazzottius varieornatus]
MNSASSSRAQRGDSRSSNTLRDRKDSIADELNLDDNVLFLDDDDFQTFFQDDYYSRLNLSRDASQEEIRNVYRRLSRLLHPDKHMETWKKKLAEDAFNRVNVAYEVLHDPYKRSLYDTAGLTGSASRELWQITPVDPKKAKTLKELQEEREKRKEDASTNAHNEVTMGIDMTDVFESGDRGSADYGLLRSLPHVEITTMNTSQSIEAQWPQVDHLHIFSNVNYERGTGGGTLGMDISKTLAEDTTADAKVMVGPSQGPIAHFRIAKRLADKRSISLSAFTAWSRFALMPLFELSYGSSLGRLGNARITMRGSSRLVYVSTRLDKEFKNSRLSGSTDVSHDDVVMGLSYSHKLTNVSHEPKLTVGVKLGFRGASLEYGLSQRVSRYNQLAASMALALPGGVSLKLTFQRSKQAFSFPILLSHDIVPAPIFYGTIAPLVLYACFKSLYLIPKWKSYVLQRLQSRRHVYNAGLDVRRREYEDFLRLMTEKYEELINSEGLSGGLVIDKALYGSLHSENESSRIEVQVALQCLIRSHTLDLSSSSKCELLGFFDPCLGEEKQLRVHYVFGGRQHVVEVADDEALHLPDADHLLIG